MMSWRNDLSFRFLARNVFVQELNNCWTDQNSQEVVLHSRNRIEEQWQSIFLRNHGWYAEASLIFAVVNTPQDPQSLVAHAWFIVSHFSWRSFSCRYKKPVDFNQMQNQSVFPFWHFTYRIKPDLLVWFNFPFEYYQSILCHLNERSGSRINHEINCSVCYAQKDISCRNLWVSDNVLTWRPSLNSTSSSQANQILLIASLY